MSDVEATSGGKRSPWMSHVKKTMKANKGKSLMQVLKMAKKTYKKSRRGGGLSPLPLTGARRGGEDEEAESVPLPAAAMGGRRKSRKAGKKAGKKSRKGGKLY